MNDNDEKLNSQITSIKHLSIRAFIIYVFNLF